MVQTLFARISEMSQYKSADRKIQWEDADPLRWAGVYRKLMPGDNAVFVGPTQKIFIGRVAIADEKKGIVECRDIEEFSARIGDMLRVHALSPERLSRMKGNFKPFIASFDIEIDSICRSLTEQHYVLFHLFANDDRFKEAQAELNEFDRIIILDYAGRFDKVHVLRRRNITNVDTLTSTTECYLDDFDGSDRFLAKGLTLDGLYEELAASKSETRDRSTMLALAKRMGRQLELDGRFTFQSFNGYHNTLFNKRALDGKKPATVTDNEEDDERNSTISGGREALPAPPLNQILFGPPGTGKTYATVEKALQILGVHTAEVARDVLKRQFDQFVKDGRIVFCTFHQSLSYEDFIEGIKPMAPVGTGGSISYRVEPGIFQRLCINASASIARHVLQRSMTEAEPLDFDASKALSSTLTPEQYATKEVPRFVLIIDEINRANVSQVFGELITLLEDDKRLGNDERLTVTLPYSKTSFGVPPNLYLIGTMNTADRSVEALDNALRRRFVFESVSPDPDELDEHLAEPLCGVRLSALMKTINARLELLLGPDHLIGHAYFMKVTDEDSLRSCLCEKIVPLLSEYFYGDIGRIGLVLGPGFIRQKYARNRSKLAFAKFDYDVGDLDQTTQYEIIAKKDIDIGLAIVALMDGVDPDAGTV